LTWLKIEGAAERRRGPEKMPGAVNLPVAPVPPP
jgi:hypothetical protein